MFFRAVEHHPALAESGNAVGFGETVEGDGQQVGRERGDGGVPRRRRGFCRKFVGEDNQTVFARHSAISGQDFFAVYRAGGVVGVDDDDGFGFGRDLASMSARLGNQSFSSSHK